MLQEALEQSCFEHSTFSRKNDGELIKRVSFYANDLNQYLKSANTRKLDGTTTQTQAETELFSDLFYNFEFSTSDSPTERLILSFTNLRTNTVSANFNFTNDQLIMDGKIYNTISSSIKGFKGTTLASSCGETDFYEDDSHYDVTAIDMNVDVADGVDLPGNSAGIIEIIIEPVNPDCLPLGIADEHLFDFGIVTYPNPAIDRVHVEYTVEFRTHDAVLILNSAAGQEIKRYDPGSWNSSVDVSQLDAGVYFFRIQSGSASSKAVSFVKF